MQHLIKSISLANRKIDLLDLELGFAGGNKYFKLKENIRHAQSEGYTQLLSFGGAWSNHIHALSIVGKQTGLKTIGVVRGERPKALSQTLVDAEQNGMTLKFVSRSDYRDKTESALLAGLKSEYGDFYLLPEGGSNRLAVEGCKTILNGLDDKLDSYDLICLPVGTGGTMAGVVSAALPNQSVLGFSAMKNNHSLDNAVEELIIGEASAQWQINHDYHCGGYAKCPEYLRTFMLEFEQRVGIELDPVYTAKMLFGLESMLLAGALATYADILVIHTGGRQGRRGFDFLAASNH